jgi:hypothetical protein
VHVSLDMRRLAELASKRQRQHCEQYIDTTSPARGPGLPRSRRTAMITAFHPLLTFSVRFARVLASPTGEKRYLRGGWCL